MKWIHIVWAFLVSLLLGSIQTPAQAQKSGASQPATTSGPASQRFNDLTLQPSNAPAAQPSTQSSYVLCASDVVQVKVYQEDDLESKLRISRDGTTTFPLIGVINLGGKTVEQAAALIRDALAKDYLVNPQVTVTVLEYAKRRFTVL